MAATSGSVRNYLLHKEFRAIKNASFGGRAHPTCEITFEDAGMEQRDEPRTICGPTAPCGNRRRCL
jgi:hypothetical protein